MTRLPHAVAALVLFLVLASGVSKASAQGSWPATFIQVATGFSGPTGEWSDQAEGGIGLSAMVAVAYRPSLQLSLEYARYGFDCPGGSACDFGAQNWTATSVRGQAEYRFADLNGMRPWVRAGISNNRIYFDSTPQFESHRAFGFVGGAGFEVGVGNSTSVLIGGRGERFNSTLPSDGGDVTVAFWAADFAFRFRVH